DPDGRSSVHSCLHTGGITPSSSSCSQPVSVQTGRTPYGSGRWLQSAIAVFLTGWTVADRIPCHQWSVLFVNPAQDVQAARLQPCPGLPVPAAILPRAESARYQPVPSATGVNRSAAFSTISSHGVPWPRRLQ